MNLLLTIYESFEFRAILKILLAGILSGLIGIERSSLNKPAGFGTHAILGISAVLVVVSSEYLSFNYDIDVSRIPAQLLTGIGFIGAGTIIKDGMNVKGVTTAAGIFAVTCIGLAIGTGYYIGGIVATAIIYLLLSYAHSISSKFERYSDITLIIKIDHNVKKTIQKIQGYLADNSIRLRAISRPGKGEEQDKEIISMAINYDNRVINENIIIRDIIDIDNVVEVEEEY